MRRTLLLFTTFVLVACAFNATAQFTGQFAPENWIFNTTPVPGTLDLSKVGIGTIGIAGNNSDDEGVAGVTSYSIAVPTTGQISFSWGFETTDNSPHWDPAFYGTEEQHIQLSDDGGSLVQAGSVTGFPVFAGDIFSFFIESDVCCGSATLTIFDFAFTPITPGSTCQAAQQIQLGNQTFNTPELSDFWYRYSSLQDGQLTVTTEGNKTITVSSSCGGGGLDLVDFGTISFPVTAGQEVYIRLLTDNETFNWNLSLQDPQIGDFCSVAMPAEVGSNIISTTSSGEYWYSFTVPSDGPKNLTIMSEIPEGLEIYLGQDCQNKSLFLNSSAGQSSFNLQANTQFWIHWINVPANFAWTLQLQSATPGSLCDVATTASQGTNDVLQPGVSYWTTFTMPNDAPKRLTITLSEFGVISVFRGSCEDLDLQAFGFNSVIDTDVSPGEMVYIQFGGYNGSFSFDLSLSDFLPGESCLAPITLANTNNQFFNGVSDIDTWYRYQAPAAGVIQFNVQGFLFLEIYNSCDDLLTTGPNTFIVEVGGGQEILIRTGSYSSVTWSATFTQAAVGAICASALALPDLTTQQVNAPQAPFWYKYTFPANGIVTISSVGTTDVNTYLEVLDGCGGDLIAENDDEVGLQSRAVIDGQAGQEIFIHWTPNWSPMGFPWTLVFDASQTPGTSCGLAETVTSNPSVIINAPGVPRWYSYTMPFNGNLTISSVGLATTDTYVRVFDGCQGSLIDENNDSFFSLQSNVVLTNLSAGETLLINWTDRFSPAPFQWSIEAEEIPQGSLCIFPTTAVVGENQTTPANRWFSFTAPGNGSYFVSSLGTATTDTWVKLYNDCGAPPFLTNNDESAGIEQSSLGVYLLAGQTILIEWSEDISVDDQFTWNIIPQNVQQTITFDPIPQKQYGDSFTLNASASSGLPITYEVLAPQIATIDNSNVTVHDIGTTFIKASQNGGNGFNPALTVFRVVTAAKRSVTVTASAATKVYGEADPTLQYTASNNLVGSDQFSGSLSRASGNNVGTYAINKGSLSLGANAGKYQVDFITADFTITPATLTASVGNYAKVYGAALPAFSLQYTGFKSNDNASIVTQAPLIETTATANSDAGQYPINVTGGNAGVNYTIQHVNGILTITQANQEITFSPLAAREFTTTPLNLSASTTSGLEVEFESLTPATVNISSGAAQFLRPGIATIRAKQPGNINYTPAAPVDITFCVNPPAPTLTPDLSNPEAPKITTSADEGISWFRDGSPMPAATQKNLTVTQAGSYTSSQVIEGCISATSLPFVILVTSLEDQFENVSAHPNPTSDYLTLENLPSDATIALIDLKGGVVKAPTVEQSDKKVIDVRQFPQGTYILLLKSARGLKQIKWIKN